MSSEDIVEITIDEIYNAFKKAKNSSAAGSDGIMPKMLKQTGPKLAEKQDI